MIFFREAFSVKCISGAVLSRLTVRNGVNSRTINGQWKSLSELPAVAGDQPASVLT